MDKELLQSLAKTIADGLRNKTLTVCSKWAQERRVMGEPVPGPYSYRFHPWCRELHDNKSSFMTAKKSAQAGFTEVAINRALYTIDVNKRNVLYVLPTKVPDAADFSAARFGAALELSPYLENMFNNTNTIGLKQAAGACLYIRGANSESGLKSIPVSELIMDEFDEMPEKSVELALERLSGQIHKHVFFLSTPTIPGWGIDKKYLESTQEHFFFPCPSCSRLIDLRWPDSFKLCGETVNDPDIHKSYLMCSECKAELPQLDKPDFLAKGRWEPTVSNGNPDHRGFNINQMYSWTVHPHEIAKKWFDGQRSEVALQEFWNSKMGEAYVSSDSKISDAVIEKVLHNYSINDAPPTTSNRLITMGIDQGKWHYLVVCEWFVESYGYDINANAKCKVLWCGKVGEGDFSEFDRLMRVWQVKHCVIDPDPNINDARRFARRFPGYVTLCRYRQGVTGRELNITEQDSGSPMAVADRTNWMDAALGRFYSPDTMALPGDIPIEYKEHLKAPARRYIQDPNGNPVAKYIETGPDHYAHAQTYAELALPLAASMVTNRSISAFL